MSCVIGSGCVFNNYIDRDIDRVMSRTEKRALVMGHIPTINAMVFGSILGIFGFAILGIFTSDLVVIIGLIGYIDYLVLYGISKRKSVHGTLVGSISGATPIVAGYCAVTGNLDSGAVILFFILAIWQMPHFYAIAMYRIKDYTAAKLPVLPVKVGMKITKIQILLYIVSFIIATILLRTNGYTGNIYLVVILVVGLAWLLKGLYGLKTVKNELWARQMFSSSLIVLLVFCFLISVNNFIK